MYIPEPFRIKDESKIADLINDYSFGQMISVCGARPFCTHLPFLFDREERCLYGHFAGKNPHAEILNESKEVLVVFSGPHSYVSPEWYEKKPAVPTWNYVAVHVYGTVEFLTDPGQVENLLSETAKKFEAASGTGWSLDFVPKDFQLGLQKGIHAFKINVDSIEAKAKLGQTLAPEDIKSLIIHLKERGQHEMALLVEQFNNLKKETHQ